MKEKYKRQKRKKEKEVKDVRGNVMAERSKNDRKLKEKGIQREKGRREGME